MGSNSIVCFELSLDCGESAHLFIQLYLTNPKSNGRQKFAIRFVSRNGREVQRKRVRRVERDGRTDGGGGGNTTMQFICNWHETIQHLKMKMTFSLRWRRVRNDLYENHEFRTSGRLFDVETVSNGHHADWIGRDRTKIAIISARKKIKTSL